MDLRRPMADKTPHLETIDYSGNADLRPTTVSESLQAMDMSSMHPQSVEMQFEHNDAAVRDVEVVSQESGRSGATLRQSLRSLDVEIGSDEYGPKTPKSDDQTDLNRFCNRTHSMKMLLIASPNHFQIVIASF
ncbi:hypothetical protein ACFX13_029317 [Malus domestica]